ncbi:MAG: IniB N-terminal domain-containing protein [Microbacterium sp.]
MSLTLTSIADALIEFILSLLRDPAAAAEFDDDPEGMLAQRGLNHANASDVASVAPIVIERTQVIQVVKPVAVEHHANPVVREIKQITTHVQWVDDRDTIVDQSVNQNIWAEGDVTQTFDQEAVVASGDDALAAGENLDNEETLDQSTTIEAGGDANIGNDTDVTVIEDSLNEDSDTSTTTDESTVVSVNEPSACTSTDSSS